MATLILSALALITVAQSEDLEALAVQAGVSPVDLQGAVNTTGLPPVMYLRATGELPSPEPAPPVSGVWDRLAACEASSNWKANTGNGYYGGLQEDMTFWRRYGGMQFAPRPDLATRLQQITVAMAGQKAQGWGAWPNCSRRLGLR